MPTVETEEIDPNMIAERVKEYLAEERFKIKLHELVSGEVRKALTVTADDYFPPTGRWSPEEFQKRLSGYEAALSELLPIQA
jgi:hypothetical protein